MICHIPQFNVVKLASHVINSVVVQSVPICKIHHLSCLVVGDAWLQMPWKFEVIISDGRVNSVEFCVFFHSSMNVHWINSSPPSAAYMHQWTGSALVQIMTCRLPGAKPLIMWTNAVISLIEPLGTNFSEIWIKTKNFFSWKCIWKCRLGNGGHFV